MSYTIHQMVRQVSGFLMARGFGVTARVVPITLLIGCSTPSVTPPSAVTQAFATRYPNTVATWDEKPYGYEGVFYQNGVEYEAEYSADGRWLETEHEVTEAAFSQAVLSRVQREYPGYAVTKHEIEQTPEGIFYEVEIERGDTEYELYFDSSATPVPNANEDS